MECSSVVGVAGWRGDAGELLMRNRESGHAPAHEGVFGSTVGSRTRKIMKMWQEFLFLVFLFIFILTVAELWAFEGLGRKNRRAYSSWMQKEHTYRRDKKETWLAIKIPQIYGDIHSDSSVNKTVINKQNLHHVCLTGNFMWNSSPEESWRHCEISNRKFNLTCMHGIKNLLSPLRLHGVTTLPYFRHHTL